MFAKMKNWLNTNNHLLWVSIIALVVLGLLGMCFVGPYEAARRNFEPNIFFNKFWPFALVGTVIMFAFSKLSKKWVIRTSWVLGIIGLLLMIKTIIDPTLINGSARWVNIGSAYIDPFMMSLPAYIVLMSHWLSKEKQNKTWTTIGTSTLTLFIIWAALIAPYVFMSQIYLLLFCILTFEARKDNSAAFKVGMIALISFVALFVLAIWQLPHVYTRIDLMFHPQMYSQTWIARQALANSAIIGNTTESLHWLATLPYSTSDYMFTSMIAKFGILMGLLIIALYGCLAKGRTNTSRNTKDKFNKLMTTGTLGLLAILVITGLAVAFGWLGSAAYWPLIGFGGMAFLTWSVLLGFVLAINKK